MRTICAVCKEVIKEGESINGLVSHGEHRSCATKRLYEQRMAEEERMWRDLTDEDIEILAKRYNK